MSRAVFTDPLEVSPSMGRWLRGITSVPFVGAGLGVLWSSRAAGSSGWAGSPEPGFDPLARGEGPLALGQALLVGPEPDERPPEVEGLGARELPSGPQGP